MRRWLVLCSCLVAAPVLAQPAVSGEEALRSEFRVAHERARAGLPATDDSEALRAYAIYPYLEAARLGRALDGAPAAWSPADIAIEDFLARHDSEPVSVNLRVAWLQSLAMRDLWMPYREHYRIEVADTGLRCRELIARIELNEVDGIAPAILAEWLTGFQLPAECEPAFRWARTAGVLDDDATAERVRLLLENGETGFARTIAARLPAARAATLIAWADLIDRPAAAIATYLGGPPNAFDAKMLLDGWSRLARDDPGTALALAEPLFRSELVLAADPGDFRLELALGLAWDRRPETLDAFAQVPAELLDDYALGWQARAALWADDSAVARRAIAAMSPEARATAPWRYWSARVDTDDDDAERLYTELAPGDNYYSAAAAAQLHDRVAIHPSALARDDSAVASLAVVPGIARARELRAVGLTVAAAREWREAYATLDAAERTQSIHVAVGMGWYDVAIATATELGIFYDYRLLYPRPFDEEVTAAAVEFDLEPSLIYAVMRQESLYRSDAESAAGAVGLMQLQRGTAREVGRQLGASTPPDPLVPADNIRLGAARLADMIERYDGLIVPALAAYNAGPAAVDRWLPPEPVAGDVWLENVPFNETREYVRRVLWHSIVFEWLDDNRVDARPWLEEIGRR